MDIPKIGLVERARVIGSLHGSYRYLLLLLFFLDF